MYWVRGGWLKTFSAFFSTPKATSISDVNKDWICKDKDKDQAYKDQQWTQSESSEHMTVKPITLNK